MFKRCTSLLLIFVMLITILPIQSFAEKDKTPENINVEENGEKVVEEDVNDEIAADNEFNIGYKNLDLEIDSEDPIEQRSLLNSELKSDSEGKYIVTRDSDGSEVGRFDLFSKATASINLSNGLEKGAYTITLTEDDLDMGIWGGVSDGYTVTLKSGEGGPYKIVCTRESNTTNSEKHFSQIAGDLILEDIILDGGGVGGGVFIMPSSPHDPTNFASLTMKSGAVIQNCKDILNVGAAVGTIGDRATLIMEEGSAILNNTAERNGGGISISGGNSFIMNGGVIKENKSGQNGGGVIVNGGSFIMNGGEISRNSAPNSYGGGLCIASNAEFELKGGTISNNTAKDGGGIYIDNRTGKFNISDMTISGNTATNRGGGIFNYPELVIQDSIISNNTSVSTGGGISAWAPIEINNTTISGNKNTGEGGGIWLRHFYNPDGISEFDNVILEKNESKWGGGIELFAGSLNMDNCSILNNKTTSNGAGIFTNGPITMNNSIVKGNVSSTVGGGIDARASVMTINKSIIDANKAIQGGGGLFLRSDAKDVDSIIKNTTIKGNEAGIGGGIVLMNKAGAQIGESTNIIKNIAGTEGGGIYTDDSDYNNPVNLNNYQKIKTDETVEFKDNVAGDGLFNPPINVSELSNIDFNSTSAEGIINPNHPINNYDINYKFGDKIKLTLTVNKVDENNNPLNGAKFKLYKLVEPAQPARLVTLKESTGIQRGNLKENDINRKKLQDEYSDWNLVEEFTITKDGKKIIEVDENAIYLIKEVEAPEGYKLEKNSKYRIEVENESKEITIKNIKLGKYKVTYNGNGNTSGTAPIDEKEYKLNEEVKVLDKGNLEKSGYTFIGWNTKADGSGISYKPKDVFNIKENTTLYAQWVRNYVPTEPEIQEPSEPVDPDPVPELNKKDHYAYMVGESDKNFRPNDNITRAEAVTIFFRMLTENARNQYWSTVNNFKDVNEAAWYNNAVSTMANAKVIEADANGNYRPNEAMTRGEFAVLLSKFFNETGTKNHNFTDIKGHFAEDEIAKVAAKGWIEGYADKTFRPDEKITRAEAVKLVNRILERTPDIKNLLPNMIEFKDNQDVDKWYYVEIQEAANSHEYTRSDSKSTETWTKLLPVRDWVALEKEWSKANSSTNPGNVK